jgi:O-antigen ligase
MYHLQAWSDKREIAVFISYIRFEMNLCFAVFVCMYVFFHDKKMQWQRFVLLLSLGWLIFLILYIGALTAIVMLVVVLSALLIKKAVENRRKRYRLVYSTVLVLILGAISVYTFIIVKQYYTVNFDIKTADKLSPDGNPYRHHIENGLIENGSYVFSYVCKQELVSAWEKRSDLPFDGCDIYGHIKLKTP